MTRRSNGRLKDEIRCERSLVTGISTDRRGTREKLSRDAHQVAGTLESQAKEKRVPVVTIFHGERRYPYRCMSAW